MMDDSKCAGHGSSTSSESSSTAVAVNNDDDNGNETDDLIDSTVEGENDLYQSRPIYGHGQSCCPCYGYGPNPDIIATRTYCSGNLRTYTSPTKVSEKTAAFPGDPVFVEGRAASPTVGAEKIIWSWTEEGEAKAATNYYTVFSVRLFGDLDFNNDVDAVDRAAVTNLTEQYGWPILVASNTLRKVELKTDVLIPGYKILSLSGDAQIRVWTTANPTTNDTPLLITGQAVTNGIDGASFGAYPSSMLYVEALDSGTATLTYSYVGTGSAEGFGCSAELGITAIKVERIEVSCDKFGTSGSFGSNPVFFEGQKMCFGNPTEPPPMWWQPGTYTNPAVGGLYKFRLTLDFDYQGIAGNPTRRYSFTDDDRPFGHMPVDLSGMRGIKGNGDWDEPSFATLCGIPVCRAKINNALYAVWGREIGYSKNGLKSGAIFNAMSRNLWPDSTIASGFWLPVMPTDYSSLTNGPDVGIRGRLFGYE